MTRYLGALVLAAAIFTLSSAPAWAQGEGAAPAPEAPAAAPGDATPPPADAPPPPAADPANAPANAPVAPPADGPRYRWGIALSGGLETVAGYSAPMAGMDARFGLQFNDLLGFYLQTHLSAGKFDVGVDSMIVGWTGTFTAAAMAEVTLIDHFFAGAGLGYGVLNNPSGLLLQFRAGGYPLATRIGNSIRRRGLMVGVDVRTVFIDGATGVLVLGSIGYEKY